MTNFVVIQKETLDKSTINATKIVLNDAAIIHTKMAREDVAEFIRQGDHLILKLKNGEMLLIENFFTQFDQEKSDLVFEEDECVLYWFDGQSGFKDIPGLEVLLPSVESSQLTGLLPWLVGGAVVGGAIIALDHKSDSKPALPKSPTVTLETVKLIVDPLPSQTTDLVGTIKVPEGSIPGVVTVTLPGLPPFTAEIDETPNSDGTYNWKVVGVPVDKIPKGDTPLMAIGTAVDPKNASNISKPSEPALGNIPVDLTAPTVTIYPVNTIVDPVFGQKTDLTGTIKVAAGSTPNSVTVTLPNGDKQRAEVAKEPNLDGTYNWTLKDVPVDQLPKGNTPVSVVGTATQISQPSNVAESTPEAGNIPVALTAPTVTINTVNTIVDPVSGQKTDLTGTIKVAAGSTPNSVTVTLPNGEKQRAEVAKEPNLDGT